MFNIDSKSGNIPAIKEKRVSNYTGIKTLLQLLVNKGMITYKEYDKCLRELDKSWIVEKEEAIEDILYRLQLKN